jgi:glycosyltransferase involved in cell wall biosynthesis
MEGEPVTGEPLISVIVPAFNAGETLAEAVRSVLDGTYTNVEVIVVDDGSTDNTAMVAQELVGADRRLSSHRRENGGVSAAFNSGLERAVGEYVARLDADDLWHPSKLELQIACARQNPEAAFIYTWTRYIDGDGRVCRDAPPQRFPQRALCRGVYESLIGANSSALMRRDVVQDRGGYDETLSSWEDLLLQLQISGDHPIAYVPEYLVGYRVRPGSLSARPDNMLRSWRKARERIDRLFPQVPKFVLDWAHGRRCAELAEGFAWKGEYGRTVRLLAEAARFDPQRTTQWLAFRSWRFATRRMSKRQVLPAARPFLDCDPRKEILPGEMPLRSLEERRIETLTKLDEELPR